MVTASFGEQIFSSVGTERTSRNVCFA